MGVKLTMFGKSENIKGVNIGYARGNDGQIYVYTEDGQELNFCYGRKDKETAKLTAVKAIDEYLVKRKPVNPKSAGAPS